MLGIYLRAPIQNLYRYYASMYRVYLYKTYTSTTHKISQLTYTKPIQPFYSVASLPNFAFIKQYFQIRTYI